jgi:hypothetical protein
MQAMYGEGTGDGVLDYLSVATLEQNVAAFRVVLDSEFQTSGIYLVTAKRGYDIPTLLENAETIFPPEVNEKLPQIQEDLREAGKCLAFNLGTAAGFHLLRALETVVCSYWYVVMNKAPLPRNRNLGQYITAMAKGDHPNRRKVLFALRQVKDLHRNSIMHPEETLNLDEAIALLNTVQSAITLMLPTVDGDHGRQLMEASAAAKMREYEKAETRLAEDAEEKRKIIIQQKQGSNPKKGSRS